MNVGVAAPPTSTATAPSAHLTSSPTGGCVPNWRDRALEPGSVSSGCSTNPTATQCVTLPVPARLGLSVPGCDRICQHGGCIMSEPSAKLDHDPPIVALANAVTELNTDGTEALRRWRHDRTVVDEINQLAKDADLTDSLVIEIAFEERLLEPDGYKHDDRWRIRVSHPVPTRNSITVYLGKFPLVRAKAALPEIVRYLEAWQSALLCTPDGSAKAKHSLKPADLKAWQSYERAIKKTPELAEATDLQVYNWVREHDADPDYDLPDFDTWARYLRRVRQARSKQKNSPRAGRAESSRSIVPANLAR